MTTIATLFSGGEGVGVGARAASLSHLWGIEYDDAIANVARLNGFRAITADVMTVDPHTLEIPDILHASPVCKRASVANQSAKLNEDGTKEAPEDIAAGAKIAQFIDVMQPKVFTLENVYAYRNFKAFKIICNALNQGGYMWDFDNLNSADYGVPQTRRRLILRAVRGSLLPNLPQPERWVGWYEAIEDLIPTLPESQFAAWQLARLPEETKSTLLVDSAGYPDKDGVRVAVNRKATEPSNTIVSNYERRLMRAFLVADEYGSSNNNGQERILFTRDTQEPAMSVKAQAKATVRAYLVGTNANDTSQAKIYQDADEPAQTVRTLSGGREIRAYLVDQTNYRDGQSTIKSEQEPVWTIPVYSPKHPQPRAWLSQGRVVAMTPCALARFQSFPDSYLLPDNKVLACKIIGNAVPPLLYQKIIKPLAEATQ